MTDVTRYDISSHRRIGIIADTHSDLSTTRRAIETLKTRNSEVIVHLGDICDSLHADLLDESMALLREHGLLAVKGNNDYLLESLLVDNEPDRFHPRTRFELKQLPMKIEFDGLCFSHSLPFEFLRSFYEPIDTGDVVRAREVFESTPYRILFAGHSHTPVLFRWHAGTVTRETLDEVPSVNLDPEERYILIVGAVSRGECGLFDRATSMYERIQLAIG